MSIRGLNLANRAKKITRLGAPSEFTDYFYSKSPKQKQAFSLHRKIVQGENSKTMNFRAKSNGCAQAQWHNAHAR
jgi:hypothetical protein